MAHGFKELGFQMVDKAEWQEQEADRSHLDHTQEAEILSPGSWGRVINSQISLTVKYLL